VLPPFVVLCVISLPGAQARRQQPPPLKFMALQPCTPLQIASHGSGPVTPGQGPWQPTFGHCASVYCALMGPFQPVFPAAAVNVLVAAAATRNPSMNARKAPRRSHCPLLVSV
jgi:hypothetical protein